MQLAISERNRGLFPIDTLNILNNQLIKLLLICVRKKKNNKNKYMIIKACESQASVLLWKIIQDLLI